jgi:hypothetical protein
MSTMSTTEGLLEAVFSVVSAPRLHNEKTSRAACKMLHKDYDSKGSVGKKISGHGSQGA